MTVRAEIDAAIASLEQAKALLPVDQGGGPIITPPPTPLPGRRILRPGASSLKLQEALNSCEPGDVIALDKTWRYEQEYTFTRKMDPPVTLATENNIPERRVNPVDAPLLASLSSGSLMPALTVEGGSGLVVTAVQVLSARGQNEIIVLEDAEKVSLDRMLIVAEGDCKRGIRGQGKFISVTRSHIANIVRQGQDCQAFFASRGGPFVLRNSYLGASGENVLFGGEDNPEGTNPTDITVEDCHLHKPLAWKQFPGSVKNNFEAKNAVKLRFRNNLLENNWKDAQNGFALLLSIMNQDGRAPWTTLEDILIEGNVFKGVENGFNMTGRGWTGGVTQQTKGVVVRRNVVETAGVFMQLAGEIADLTVEENVVDNGFNIMTLDPGDVLRADGSSRPSAYCVGQLKCNRNIMRHNDYGIHSSVGSGRAALAAMTQTYEFQNNRIVGLPMNIPFPATTLGVMSADLDTAKQALLAELGWS